VSGVLNRPTLVLNRHWQPVHVTTVHRAVAMLWSEVAEVVCPVTYQLYGWDQWITMSPADGDRAIRTGRLRFGIPDVIRLPGYDRPPKESVPFTRRNLIKRDHHTCQYCGVQPGADSITLDHVLPRSRGGASSWANCVAACVRCNSRKADRTPEQAGMRLLREPHKPDWKPFFAASGAKVKSWAQFMPRPERQLAIYG